MTEVCNPMIQLPQLLEALLIRLESMLVEYSNNPARKEATEALLHRLRKQTNTMHTVVDSSSGEKLTPEQTDLINKVPIPQVGIFPQWAEKK